jgi:parallel beta-helix repeat protein
MRYFLFVLALTEVSLLMLSGCKKHEAGASAAPVANFTATTTSGDVSLTVQFTDASTGNITSWSWNFGAGASPATADTQGPHNVTYNTEGLKAVSLRVTGLGGSDTETKVDYINVLPLVPVADFTANPRTGTASLTVNFTDTSTGTITSWAWDFNNDGTTDSTVQNPSYAYSNPGSYTVKLTVTGPGGSDDETKTDYITVNPLPPPSDLTGAGASTTSITSQWTDNSTDETGFEIQDSAHNAKGTVGAGVTSCVETSLAENTQYTRHVHAVKSGSYSAPSNDATCYTLVRDATASDFTLTAGAFTEGFEAGNISGWTTGGDANWSATTGDKHSAAYSAVSGDITDDQFTYIERTFTIAAGGGTLTFWWKVSSEEDYDCLDFYIDDDWQDGITGTGGGWAQRTYPLAAGTRTLTWVYVKDESLSEGSDCGWIDDVSITMQVTGSTVTIIVSPPPNLTAGSTGVRIERGSDGTDFPTTVQDYAATYSTTDTPGSGTWYYRVRFRNGDGIASAYSPANSISVSSPPPVAHFSGSPRSAVDPPLTVSFTDESTGSIISWAWDFDNNGVTDSTEQNPSYTYNARGRFTVKLTVTGSEGSSIATKTDYVRVCSVNKTYVRTGGSDANSGLTWALAKKTIQAGINAASADWAVLVAKGTYNGTNNFNLDFAGKAIHLKGVTAGGTYDVGTTWTIDCENVSGRRGFIFRTGETPHTVVDNFTIYRGNAGTANGGGVYCEDSFPTFTNCTISGNSANTGGGLYCEDSSPTFTNCTISGNSANRNGGGVYCNYSSNPTFTNCTISGNSADRNGGGVCCSSSSPTFRNSIIWGNSATSNGHQIYVYTGCSVTLSYSCYASSTKDVAGSGQVNPDNCINNKPRFVDAANGDYHLQAASPCIDAGDNLLVPAGITTDLDGNPRIRNGTVDLGAYEYQP